MTRFTMQTWISAALIVGLVIALHVMPTLFIPELVRGEVLDLAHVAGFAALSILSIRWHLHHASDGSGGVIRGLWSVIAILVTLAFVSEFAQVYARGRSASAGDLLRDFSGIAAGTLLALQSIRLRKSAITAGIAILAIGLFVPGLLLTGKLIARTRQPVIATFDRPFDNYIYQARGARISIVPAPEVWGQDDHVLHVQPRPRRRYRGVSFFNFYNDWSQFDALTLTVSSGSELASTLTLSVLNQNSRFELSDQYNESFEIDAHPIRIRIPLIDIAGGPKGEKIDLSRIGRLILSVENDAEFYVDDLVLE